MMERLYIYTVEIVMLTLHDNDYDIDNNNDDDDEYNNHTTIDYDCKTTTIRHWCDSTCEGVVTE